MTTLSGPPGTPSGGGELLVRLKKAVAAARWYWRGVIGADAYERYVAHLRRTHPDAPVPSKKQFWKDKYAEMERNPRSRCC